MIKNFILLFCQNKDESYVNEPKMSSVNKDEFQSVYKSMQRPFLNISIKMLSHFYPDSTIHILTNDSLKSSSKNVCIHIKSDLPRNHLAKFKIYNLINEPAMYMDTDILINRPFPETATYTKNDINMFQKYNSKRLSNYLGIESATVYNASTIWINRPSDELNHELEEINRSVFSDDKRLVQNDMCRNNDEFSLSYYCMKHQIEMNLDESISKPRPQISLEDISKYQSVHYAKMEFKKKMIQEFHQLHSYIKLL